MTKPSPPGMEETAIEGMMHMSTPIVPESREQFRTRLTDAMRRSQPYSDWECVWDTTLGEMGEAVYAQAIRDVCQFLSTEDQSITGYVIGTRHAAIIRDWAAERGIDLGHQP